VPGSVREGINPSPTLDPLNPVFGYFRIELLYLVATHQRSEQPMIQFPECDLIKNLED
jgi:hypothetical protein